jgi:hypothetical protein
MGGKRCRDLVASINSGYDSDVDFIPFNDPLSDSDEVENNDSDDAHSSNSDVSISLFFLSISLIHFEDIFC